jgi:co-chaperonin GroES (HSP10)
MSTDEGDYRDAQCLRGCDSTCQGIKSVAEIDSIGYKDCEYKIGDKVAFEEIGGVMLSTEMEEYVVITPEMVIGIL